MPKAHRLTPFELAEDEWRSTLRLLRGMKDRLESEHGVTGWNVGWNVHGVAGQNVEHVPPLPPHRPVRRPGIRWWIKQAEKRRQSH